MPHKCAACGNMYDNYSVEIVNGCSCGSKLFVYQKAAKKPDAEQDVKRDGALPGPAAEKIDFVEEVRKTVKSVKGKRRRKGKMEFDLDSIKIIEEGVYDININKILNNEPLVIEVKEDGKYYIHLASVFQKKVEGLEKEHLGTSEKKTAAKRKGK